MREPLRQDLWEAQMFLLRNQLAVLQVQIAVLCLSQADPAGARELIMARGRLYEAIETLLKEMRTQ